MGHGEAEARAATVGGLPAFAPIEQQPGKLLGRCKAIGTSTWSDALDQCGISGVVRGLAQRSGRGRFAGFAVTARERAGALGSFPRTDFGVGKMIAAIGPGDVLLRHTLAMAKPLIRLN